MINIGVKQDYLYWSSRIVDGAQIIFETFYFNRKTGERDSHLEDTPLSLSSQCDILDNYGQNGQINS